MPTTAAARDRAYRVVTRFLKDLLAEELGVEWHPKYEFRVTEMVGAIIHAAVMEARESKVESPSESQE